MLWLYVIYNLFRICSAVLFFVVSLMAFVFFFFQVSKEEEVNRTI